MKVTSRLTDARIGAENLLVELSIAEYEELVKDVLDKNEFQRKRVRSSKTVYALLREDLLRQCVIPPIVLALTNKIEIDKHELSFSELKSNKDHLVILDGLQRTNTIFDLLSELRAKSDEEKLKTVENNPIRVEIYIGLNRLGILYRMLTLNTGQTPMSLRHQIEMLYLDYQKIGINGVELVREVEGRAIGINQYNFKEIVEGFNAYLDRDELPIEKADILENINSLEKLSKENQSTDLFENYVKAIHHLIQKIDELCGDIELDEDYIESKGVPFGKNALQIFKKAQAMSGFGAAIGKLIDYEVISNIDEVIELINNLEINDTKEFLEEINNNFSWLKNKSKKIGNAQRSYFTFLFRDLFNKDSDSYLNLSKATNVALRKYQAQNM